MAPAGEYKNQKSVRTLTGGCKLGAKVAGIGQIRPETKKGLRGEVPVTP